MNATAAKASPRKLRKAFGPAAMYAIGARDHQLRVLMGQVNELTDSLARHQAIWQAHTKLIGELDQRIHGLSIAEATHDARWRAYRTARLLARLKYLLFGSSFA